jgi:AraC-like DNA-binding protein
MTHFHQEVLRLQQLLYPHDHLVRQVRQAKAFIDQNYSTALQLEDMAEEAMLSKFHFARLFKAYYGRTPHRYLTEVRIAHAKALLRAGASVVEACEAVGFESVSTFTGLFKKTTHQTPGVYRRYLEPFFAASVR